MAKPSSKIPVASRSSDMAVARKRLHDRSSSSSTPPAMVPAQTLSVVQPERTVPPSATTKLLEQSAEILGLLREQAAILGRLVAVLERPDPLRSPFPLDSDGGAQDGAEASVDLGTEKLGAEPA